MSADDIDDELFALAGGDEDADVEEGEASSVAASSPNSLGSDAMDESDSDRDDGEALERTSDVPYPLEGKYIDAKDKARINAMTQLEREAILGQRAEEMSKVHFQAELARRAANMQNDRKRKADSEEPDDAMRKSSRQKTKAKTNDKLEAYKREREQRGQQRQRHDDRRNGRRRSSSADRDGGSDVDAEGESEVEWDDPVKQVREEPPANLQDFESIRVGRGFFAKVCFYPGFEETMVGTFGRIGVGQDSQRRTLYKMAQIKGFTTGKPYVFEGNNGQRVATDQYVIAQHGTVKKEYQFQFLSNQRFTDTDIETYKQSLSETNAKVPNQGFVKRKFDDLKNLENRFWTDADINARIAKTDKYAHLLRSNHTDSAQPKIATQSEAAAARIAEINRQNRRTEAERVRKALLEQRTAQQQERKRMREEMLKKEAEKKAAEEAAQKKQHLEVDALFDGDSSRASTPKPTEQKKKTERKGLPTFRKPKMDDDLIASLDIGVDIEI